MLNSGFFKCTIIRTNNNPKDTKNTLTVKTKDSHNEFEDFFFIDFYDLKTVYAFTKDKFKNYFKKNSNIN